MVFAADDVSGVTDAALVLKILLANVCVSPKRPKAGEDKLISTFSQLGGLPSFRVRVAVRSGGFLLLTVKATRDNA